MPGRFEGWSEGRAGGRTHPSQVRRTSRADSCPGTESSIPPTPQRRQHGWTCKTPPPKRNFGMVR